MSKRMVVLNIILVITDLILSALAVCAFTWCAVYFHKWWIILFTLIPVILYNNHSMILDSDIRQSKEDERKGGEDNSRE